MPKQPDFLPLLILLAALVLLPVLQRPVIASEILILGIAAVAANLLIGYCGLLPFGQAMFFGTGAYTAGILVTRFEVALQIAVPAATGAAAVLAYLTGLLCVRRVGLYFLMITFAFNQMLYFLAYSFPLLTGGEDGLPSVGRPHFLSTQISFYIFVSVIFLFALGIMRRLTDSPAGRVWMAIKDNPARAAAAGYDIQFYRLLAFTISGAFTGLAGALFAFVFEFVPIDKIHWSFSGDILFMTLAGGTGYFIGPVIGAALYTWLQETVSTFWSRWPLVLGLVFLAVLRFSPAGIAGLFGDMLTQRRSGIPKFLSARKVAR